MCYNCYVDVKNLWATSLVKRSNIVSWVWVTIPAH
jgi:hypothetical protein